MAAGEDSQDGCAHGSHEAGNDDTQDGGALGSHEADDGVQDGGVRDADDVIQDGGPRGSHVVNGDAPSAVRGSHAALLCLGADFALQTFW